jgi:hypothetical protein
MSSGVRSMRSPTWEPLLRMDRWVRHAALGMAVVPDVNWMLTMSFGLRFRSVKGRPSADNSDTIDENGVKLLYEVTSTRPAELSRRMICFRVGTRLELSFELQRSPTRCWSSGILLRGSLRGRLDSVLIIRWLDSRCPNAAAICMALNEGFNGTLLQNVRHCLGT